MAPTSDAWRQSERSDRDARCGDKGPSGRRPSSSDPNASASHCGGPLISTTARKADVETARAPRCPQGRRPGLVLRSSIPGPPVPLSTLRPPPRDGARKTQGQDGSRWTSGFSSAGLGKYFERGLDPIHVDTPAGTLELRVEDDDIYLQGPAEIVAEVLLSCRTLSFPATSRFIPAHGQPTSTRHGKHALHLASAYIS